MTLPSRGLALLAALALLVGVAGSGSWLARRHWTRVAVAGADLARAQAVAHAALTRAARDDSAVAAARERERRDSLLADSLRVQIALDSADAAHARAAYRAVADVAAVPCHIVVQRADLALAADQRTVTDLRTRSDSLQDALRRAIGSRDSLSASHQDLEVATGQLGHAATVFARASRPSVASRLLPKVGVGVTAGLNPVTGRPDLVAGVTVGWTL